MKKTSGSKEKKPAVGGKRSVVSVIKSLFTIADAVAGLGSYGSDFSSSGGGTGEFRFFREREFQRQRFVHQQFGFGGRRGWLWGKQRRIRREKGERSQAEPPVAGGRQAGNQVLAVAGVTAKAPVVVQVMVPHQVHLAIQPPVPQAHQVPVAPAVHLNQATVNQHRQALTVAHQIPAACRLRDQADPVGAIVRSLASTAAPRQVRADRVPNHPFPAMAVRVTANGLFESLCLWRGEIWLGAAVYTQSPVNFEYV